MTRILSLLILLAITGAELAAQDLYTRRYHAPSLISNAASIAFDNDDKDRSVIERALLNLGVELPIGASATSADGQTLVLRTTLPGHEVTEIYLESLKEEGAKQIHIFHEIIEVELEDFSRWLLKNRMSGDADELRDELQEWIEKGRAVVYHVGAITARSGQRAKSQAVEHFLYPSEFTMPSLPAEVALSGDAVAPIVGVQGTALDLRNVGVTLEVDPVIAGDGVTIDLNLAPEVVEHGGSSIWPHETTDELRKMEFPTFRTGQVTTQVVQIDGHYGLLGTTRPKEPAEGFEESILVHLVRSDIGTPGGDGGEGAISDLEPVPDSDTSSASAEFETRVFRVTSTVTTSAKGAKAKSRPSDGTSGQSVLVQPSAQSVLEQAGVTFSTGASAIYNPDANSLVVRNTQDQLKLVEEYMRRGERSWNNQLLLTTEFIEVPHSLASDWLAANPQAQGANQLREQAQKWIDDDEAKVLDLTNVTARSGQRAKTESVSEYIYGTEMSPGDVANEIELEDGAKGPVIGPVFTAFETKKVGLTLEVDPVIGADGYTVDLNLAPEIVTLVGHDLFPAAEADPSLQVALPRFHELRAVTQVTVSDGKYELLSISRPADSSEGFEDTVVLIFVRADVSRIGPESQR